MSSPIASGSTGAARTVPCAPRPTCATCRMPRACTRRWRATRASGTASTASSGSCATFSFASLTPPASGEALAARPRGAGPGRGPVPLPSAPRAPRRRERTVEPSELDPLGHLNNAAYVDHLEAGLAEAGFDFATQLPRQVRMEDLMPAAAGGALLPETWRGGDSRGGR